MPMVGFLNATLPTVNMAAFRDGPQQAGFIEGQNVAIEYRWAEGHYDRLANMAADLVRGPISGSGLSAKGCGGVVLTALFRGWQSTSSFPALNAAWSSGRGNPYASGVAGRPAGSIARGAERWSMRGPALTIITFGLHSSRYRRWRPNRLEPIRKQKPPKAVAVDINQIC